MSIIILFIITVLASVYLPEYVLLIMIVSLAVGFLLSFFPILLALLPVLKPKKTRFEGEPFISIFVPAYNEPPVLLMQTLKSLSLLDYDNFEVMIIDNNTEDEKVWKPVKKFADTLGSKFRYFHVNPLKGFKAGALNYLIERMNPKSEYVAVVDADYSVKEDFVTTALSYFASENIALVQFPQVYRNCIKQNQPVADEYRHFFGIYMNMANRLDCVPSTGTMSVYRTSVVKEVNGFRGEILTEDADIALRIHKAGYRGVFVDCAIGFGLMPYDFEAYKRQKWRWSFGNAQSIKTLFSLYGKIPFKSWLGFMLSLTAWNHLNFLPFAIISAYAVMTLFHIEIFQSHYLLLVLASLSLLITFTSKWLLLWISLRNKKDSLSRSWSALMIHMGMTLIYSEAWLSALFRTKSVFVRTNKFILSKMPNLFKNSYQELLLGTLFLVAFINMMFTGGGAIEIAVFTVSAFILLSVVYVYWKISPTKEYSKNIFVQLDGEFQKYNKSEDL